MLLSQCDKTNENLEKQQNEEGHMQEPYSESFSSLGGIFTLFLQLKFHLI